MTSLSAHFTGTPDTVLSASAASPTTAEQVKEVVEENVKTPFGITWADLLGTPLRILVIILVTLVLIWVARKLIGKFARNIAKGTSSTAAKLAAVEPGTAEAILFERRKQRGHTVGSMLGSVATVVISTISVLMILTELGFNLAPVLASAGIAGIAIGFGAQELVRDYLSGFFIVVEDQFGLGDVVDLGEAIGVVEEVGLRTTKVRAVDGTLWHVRNGEILRVGNHSQGWARAVLDVPVPYDASQERIDEIINDTIEALRGQESTKDAILEDPEIWGVEAISGESITVRTVIKTQPGEQWAVARAFRAELKRQLDSAGVVLPFQQQTVMRTYPAPTETAEAAQREKLQGKQKQQGASGAEDDRPLHSERTEKPMRPDATDEDRSEARIRHDRPSED
ncbi:mechanosensitive ion channel family protein [Brevibacterium litoralis]|uniref:mechanosensitive ion channel family protein n=1 Tax=Brevibacterium litoralis TaxID=3138935 RepID=UPI0032EBE54D